MERMATRCSRDRVNVLLFTLPFSEVRLDRSDGLGLPAAAELLGYRGHLEPLGPACMTRIPALGEPRLKLTGLWGWSPSISGRVTQADPYLAAAPI